MHGTEHDHNLSNRRAHSLGRSIAPQAAREPRTATDLRHN
jgi:hypothetical protein